MFMVGETTDESSAGRTDCFTAPQRTQRIVRRKQRTWRNLYAS